MDADVHGINEIKEAIQLLRNEGEVVRTRVFAPPGRRKNKKWACFLKQPDVHFHPVPRHHGMACTV